ncbi:hypothetical protein A2767_02960 [Candidatus Roizmanbacteria bacterium RIFCSPHIGHO2_01_FULL_35_10]|uniref:PIN domain-containing protein n=1 Tax=Candidatus Roizmanbacteria bacterium RIFCSPLOWO2_01_FULL_35_13 TaxID=1802055 RepID=A0A1F7ICM0_9BACT|nr:MAG: hypothetical protein A2767_02960 [Candidatus Roizmanbacteria bacterium RIFCSPHIGHO2_01_FULL_35_10]OGK41105.1 MAG: hypothetical protein A3A74_02055 [Candidatus Roizmanbacteria bacterium RIFCSPLOWO2_01_FULL_35_13]
MKLFLDANVIYSAAKSISGASFAIFQLKIKFKINLISSKLALVEAERNIFDKEDYKVVEGFYQVIKTIKFISVDSKKAKIFYKNVIEEKDTPILYGAKQSKADFLITLDKKHFFTEKMKNKKFLFKIMTPGNFIMSLK